MWLLLIGVYYGTCVNETCTCLYYNAGFSVDQGKESWPFNQWHHELDILDINFQASS